MSLITSNDLSLNSLLYKTVNYVNDINNYITANFTKEDYAFEIKVKCILGTKIDILKDDISIYSEICKDAEDTTYGYVYYKTINPGIYKVKATLNGKTTYSNAFEFKSEQEESLFVDLNSCSWDKISQIAKSGQSKNYFSVGETKQIELNGVLNQIRYYGQPTEFYFNHDCLNVFILGFNHDEEKSITFGCFKYNSDKSDNQLSYIDVPAEFNHCSWPVDRGFASFWPSSDIRYDFLGSCDEKPKDYSSIKSSYENVTIPTVSCAKNPVEKSFMSILPSDLREVMRPMEKITRHAGTTGVSAGTLFKSIDYLPLLSLTEIYGDTSFYNGHEGEQYEYFYHAILKKNLVFVPTGIHENDRGESYIMTRSMESAGWRVNHAGFIYGVSYDADGSYPFGILTYSLISIFPIFMV